MCTATWLFNENGYDLFFNRDELNTRKIAFSPTLKSVNSLSYLSPTDADEGGTWIAVNQFGLSLFLLNFYHADFKIKDNFKFKSRGLIIPNLINENNPDSVFSRLNDFNLTNYRPFILAVISPDHSVSTFSWNGTERIISGNVDLPLCSSSFKSLDVINSRTQRIQSEINSTKNLTADYFIDLHKSHFPDKSAFSICMHRDDAQTVSLSHIRVTENKISFSYLPGNPCNGNFLPAVYLDRIKE